MPKTLIVHDAAGAALAEVTAEGARSVRFAEVDVRHADSATLDDLPTYDAVIVVGSLPALERLAAVAGRDVVASAAGDEAWRVLEGLGRLGFLLVPPGEDAGAQGKRVATVAEWVRHAKSHHHHH